MFKRFLCDPVAEALEDTPVLLITGARQTGKSTFCRQLIEDKVFKGPLVTMDDPATLTAARTDPMGFLLNREKHLIIDEVQRVPELFLSLKKLIDEDRKSRRVILTGSSDVRMLPKGADSLAGRLEIHNIWPLSLCEMAGKPSSFLKTLLSEKSKFKTGKWEWKEWMGLIRRGGYPEAVARKSEKRRNKWFDAYLSSIIQKDIRELANIEGLIQLPKILRLLSTRVGSTVNMSDIARLVGVKNTSFQRYIALLEQVFLLVKIPAWTPNAEGRYVKSPKIFLNDTGLLCNLKGDGENLLEDHTAAGSLLENFVVMEIIKQMGWFEEPLSAMHFSMHKGAEVDLVLEDRRKRLYGIEIKSKASLNKTDFKGLKKLAGLAGKKFQKGIVFYMGDQALGGFGGKNLYAVPLINLWNNEMP